MEGVTEQTHSRHHLSDTVYAVSNLQPKFLNYLHTGDEHQFLNPQKLVFISRCVQKL